MTVLSMGALFEMPLAILIATRLGVVTPTSCGENRRYALLVIAVDRDAASGHGSGDDADLDGAAAGAVRGQHLALGLAGTAEPSSTELAAEDSKPNRPNRTPQ